MKIMVLLSYIVLLVCLVACTKPVPTPTIFIAAAPPSVVIQSAETLNDGEPLPVIADGRTIALFAEASTAENVTYRWALVGSGTLKNETSSTIQYITPDVLLIPEEQVVITVVMTNANGIQAKDGVIIRLVAPEQATPTSTPTMVIPTPPTAPDIIATLPITPSVTIDTAIPLPTPTSTPTATPTRAPRQTVLDSFEGGQQMDWWSPDSHVFSWGATDERAYLGNQSLKIRYTKTDTYQFVAFEVSSDLRDFSWAQVLRVWVYGNVTVLLKLEDETLSQADVAILDATNSTGWTLLSFNLQTVSNKIDLNRIRTVFFFIEPGNVSASGEIYFDSVALQE